MDKQTWVYLIKDNTTGFHKIGRSINPIERLKKLIKQDTLMPLPNDFILVEAWLADNLTETQLHTIHSYCRKRGEWFDLPESAVKDIYTRFLYHVPLINMEKEGMVYRGDFNSWTAFIESKEGER